MRHRVTKQDGQHLETHRMKKTINKIQKQNGDTSVFFFMRKREFKCLREWQRRNGGQTYTHTQTYF
jgi:hypothetical protein